MARFSHPSQRTPLKLGKLAPRHDPNALLMANYLTSLPHIPTSVNWEATHVTNLGMMLNDQLGDCTCACAGHMIQLWTADESTQVIVSDNDILKAYEAVGGYVPGDPSTDNGAVETTVLQYWQKTGIGGHKIYAFVSCEPQNPVHIKAAVSLFGGVYIGVSLPATAQSQSGAGMCWSVPPGGPVGDGAPGSWGGHAVPVIGYNDHTLAIITWGTVQYMTWNFWNTYCDESYAVLSADWAGKAGAPFDGFNLQQLNADLNLVKN